MEVKLPESLEREIFRDLLSRPVEGQASSRPAAVAERHGITLDAIKNIERKGMARNWPPLD